MSDQPLTRSLARWIVEARYRDIPPKVRSTMRLHVLDTLGAALAGRGQPWSKAAREWAVDGAHPKAGAPGTARIWGEATGLRTTDAAFVNGVACGAYELDDFHNAKLHPGAAVLPATLALGEALDAKGSELEPAILIGYEVAVRTSLALNPSATRERGWHISAVVGPLGAAAAAATLLKLDEEKTSWALGLAGTSSSGLWAFGADGSASKRFHPGRSAQSGLLAAELANRGFSGPSKVYETRDGLLRAFSNKPDPDQLLERLGEHWHAAETNFKIYPCNGSVSPMVDAAIALRHQWKPGRRVRVGMSEAVRLQNGYDYEQSTELNAQMSARYCVAAGLLDGQIGPEQFAPTRIADPMITKVAQSVEIVRDSRLDALYPAHFCGWTEVEQESGEFVRLEFLDPAGSHNQQGLDETIRRKFDGLLTGLLPRDRIETIKGLVDSLESTDARAIVSALTI